MSKPVDKYWGLILEETSKALEKNGFTTHVVKNAGQAKKLVLGEILPGLKPGMVSFGGSMTVVETGVYEAVKGSGDYEVLDTYDMSAGPEKVIERRREALTSDVLITGTNAVAKEGILVNLDGTGNRVASLAFGPKNVIVLVGRNKVVPGLEEAMVRIKEVAAPINAMRLNRKTPCAKTGRCMDCDSPERICSVWAISEKSCPKGRIIVVLIDQDMGF